MKAWPRILTAFALLAYLPVDAAAQSSLKAPALVLRDIRGRQIRLTDYRGKVLLLNFWATWCPPCRAEVPELIKMQAEYRTQGLRIIGVTYPPQTPRQVRRFVREMAMTYPVALGTRRTRELFDKSETLPLTVIIDRQGNIRDVIHGILLPEEIEQQIKPLLR